MNGMMATPPKHARIAVVPGCVVIEPIECLVYVYANGHVLIDVQDADIHSEAEDIAQATTILASALAKAFSCLSDHKRPLSPLLKKKQEYLSKHLKQAT